MVGGSGGRGSGGGGGGRGNAGGKVKGRGGGSVKEGGRGGSGLNREGGRRFLSTGREEEMRRSMSFRRDSMRSQEESEFEEDEGRRRKERSSSTVQNIVRNLEGGGGGLSGGGAEQASNPIGERNVNGEQREEERMVFDVRTPLEGLNEFDFGAKMAMVSDSVKAGVRTILDRMEKDDLDLAGIRRNVQDGLVTLVTAVEAIMNGLSDGVRNERLRGEEVMKETDRKVKDLEEQVRKNADREQSATQERNRRIRVESAQVMTEKLQVVERQIKYMDIDFGRQTSSRREIVEKTISFFKEDIEEEDRRRLDTILRRTQFIILGKGTTLREIKDGDDEWIRIHTVPIMLECRTVSDKVELEDMLRKVGWYPVYHWPKECLEVVKELRYVVRNLGYDEKRYFVKVRPDWREGRMELKAEVKETRVGGRFRAVATWDIPPIDRRLWSAGQLSPKKVFNVTSSFGGRQGGGGQDGRQEGD